MEVSWEFFEFDLSWAMWLGAWLEIYLLNPNSAIYMGRLLENGMVWRLRYGMGFSLGIFSRTGARRSGGMFVWNWRGPCWIFWMGPSLLENGPQSLQLV